jgi:hypothetical protein
MPETKEELVMNIMNYDETESEKFSSLTKERLTLKRIDEEVR